MNLKKIVNKHKWLKKIAHTMKNQLFGVLTLISPELNTRVHYRVVFKKKLNLENPKTFNEKLLWLKLKKYIYDPLVIQCADKIKVRDYVEKKGCAHILNELIGVYDSVEQINWDTLPYKFVLKWNFGAGMNIVCTNKNEMNKSKVMAQMKKWGKNKYWYSHSEMQYKYIKPKIICEKFLSEKNSEGLTDYKVYCFNGVPRAVLVMHDRYKEMKTEFFDTNWELLENTELFETTQVITPKPKCLEEMLNVSKKLSEDFPFVRCDYYIVNDKLYFGELTFTPAAGLYTAETVVHGKTMAELLDLSQVIIK